MRGAAAIEKVTVSAYRVPTETPESDGTLEWDSTTLVTVEITAGGRCGLGFTYADLATATLIADRFADRLRGCDAWDIPACVRMLRIAVRNLGAEGIAAMAISATDVALWDLKARLLEISMSRLLGRCRPHIAAYGSGGFTSYEPGHLCAQLADWARAGMPAVKMKVGRDPAADEARVAAARHAIGFEVGLFVDANGAYTRKQALQMAQRFAAQEVCWFEEPVSSDDLEGLRLLRDRAPPGMSVSAGEYGYRISYFERMLAAGAVDVLQADATRCGGVSGFLAADALCAARNLPLSSHCAPALHVPLACAARRAVHVEYFHDHARIEALLFEGAPRPVAGTLACDDSRPGFGLELKRADADRYRI